MTNVRPLFLIIFYGYNSLHVITISFKLLKIKKCLLLICVHLAALGLVSLLWL